MISKLAAKRAEKSKGFPLAAILLVLLAGSVSGTRASDTLPGDNATVMQALEAELRAAQDADHPMEYRLRKSTPRLTSTKEIIETRDGAVARLVMINDAAPSPSDREKDDARLEALLADPSRQRKRKQNEQDDTGRVLKALRALPKAFLYQYVSSESKGPVRIEHYVFRPNPKFTSSDLELEVLTAMAGELSVDTTHQRVVRLEGHLQQDVDIGWGLLGRLNKGGSIVIEQADVGQGQWRIVHFQMEMNGRVLFKARIFDTTEEQTQFVPVPVGMTYQQAIQMLRSGQGAQTGQVVR
jgi:hypothetical protein